MQPQVSDAIVLRHLDYGESDRIVTLLTPDHGRLKGFARGARRSRKRFGPALEPFARVRLHWSRPASGELVTLREAELVDLRDGLRRNLEAFALAAYGCELLDELLGASHEGATAFNLLEAFLAHLCAGGTPRDARLLYELRLLNLAGYIPHLLHCSDCGGPLPEQTVDFDADRGGSLCPVCSAGERGVKIDLLTLGTLARCLRSPVEIFAGVRFGAATLEQGEALVAAAMQPYLPRPLKSLPFLEQLLGPPAGRDSSLTAPGAGDKI